MNKFISLVIVAGVVNAFAIGRAEDESNSSMDTFEVFHNEYYSPEAKQVADELEKYVMNKIGKLESILDQLEKDNSAVDALKNYHDTVKLAESSKCSVDAPKGLATAEETITTAAEVCADSISLEDFDSVARAVDKTFDRIESIDKRIKEIDDICSTPVTPDCVEERKQIVGQLSPVLSPDVISNFDNLVYEGAKDALDVCLEIVTQDLQNELDLHSNNIKECLASTQH